MNKVIKFLKNVLILIPLLVIFNSIILIPSLIVVLCKKIKKQADEIDRKTTRFIHKKFRK